MHCVICGTELHPTTKGTCWPCRQKLEEAEMVTKVQECVEYLCQHLNSSISDASKVAEAFYTAVTGEHRYLQGSLMDAFQRFLKLYGEAPHDDRNAWAVAWAEKATKAP